MAASKNAPKKLTKKQIAKAAVDEERMKAIHATLATVVSDHVGTEEWSTLLEAKANVSGNRIGRLSFMNIFTLWLYAPGARYSATYKAWQKSGRQVIAGEKARWIQKPFFRKYPKDEINPKTGKTETVWIKYMAGTTPLPHYTEDQTEKAAGDNGRDLPAPAAPLLSLDTPEGFELTVEAMKKMALSLDCVSAITIRPTSVGGEQNSAAGWYERSSQTIVVIDDGTEADKVAVLAHELGHAILHQGEAGAEMDRGLKEVEAESVAYVVCKALGLDSSKGAAPYIAGWGEGKVSELILETGQRVCKAAQRILDAVAPAAEEEVTEAA